MAIKNYKNLKQIGENIARFFKANCIFIENGFIIEKRDKISNTYFRINFIDKRHGRMQGRCFTGTRGTAYKNQAIRFLNSTYKIFTIWF